MAMEKNDLKKRFEAMIDSFSDRRLRWLVGKGRPLIEKREMKSEEYEALMENILRTEMERKMIINELKSGPLTVSEISERLTLPKKQIFKHLMALKRLNVIAIREREEELEFHLL